MATKEWSLVKQLRIFCFSSKSFRLTAFMQTWFNVHCSMFKAYAFILTSGKPVQLRYIVLYSKNRSLYVESWFIAQWTVQKCLHSARIILLTHRKIKESQICISNYVLYYVSNVLLQLESVTKYGPPPNLTSFNLFTVCKKRRQIL